MHFKSEKLLEDGLDAENSVFMGVRMQVYCSVS